MKTKSLRESKKESTRERLIDVATELFLSKGFDNTTIDEIAENAGISQRSFFRYFPTKEAIVFRNQPLREKKLRELLNHGADIVPPFERITSAVVAMSHEYFNTRDLLLTELKIVNGSTYLRTKDIEADYRMEKLFGATLRTFRGRTYLSRTKANVVAAAIFGSLRVFVDEWFDRGCRSKLSRQVKSGIEFMQVLKNGYAGQIDQN